MKKYIIYTTILVITLIAFSKAVSSVHAQTVSDDSNSSANVPTTIGSDSSVETPVTNGSNDIEAPVTPVTGADNGSGTASGISANGTDNGNGGTSGIPTNGTDNGNGGTSGIPTNSGDNSTGGGTSPFPSYSVVTAIDSGSGTITCGDSACPSPVTSGTSITFTASPDSGYTFASWGGACSQATSSTCTLVINGDESVSANFTATPATPSNNSTGGSGGFVGGGSSSFGGNSIVPSVAASPTTVATAPVVINSCPLLTSYLQFGKSNNASDVTKLQAFLKESQGINVAINGVFDQQTENAVRAFQAKYLSQVMGPWGVKQPSGYVYITTVKKINELACNASLTLSPSELAIIDAYKEQVEKNAAAAASAPTVESTPTVSVPASPVIIPTETSSTDATDLAPVVGQNGTGTSANTAAVVNAGGFQRFWNFIKSIF